MVSRCFWSSVSAASLGALAIFSPPPCLAEDDEGFASLFDGESLSGWSGDPSLWRVEEGTIVGETKAEAPIERNHFLTWSDGELDDFELKVEFKIDSGNSGIQVRSFALDEPHAVGGYQADIDADNKWSGTCYGEKFRGILAKRGQRVVLGNDGKPKEVEDIGDPDELAEFSKPGEWNEYRIVGRGFVIEQFINGRKMSEVVDQDEDTRRRAGLLAFQVHKGPPMKVAFRNIRLKRLPLEDVAKIVFVAGKPSHAPGHHEHNAGSLLLADLLNEHHGDKVLATVYRNGWPSDPAAFHNADAVVVFADGGQRHPAFFHLQTLEDLRRRGIGFGAIHYAVEMVPGETNDALIESIGGAFEVDYSVNPHWTAEFDDFPDHPVARGLEPFEIEDEWYFNMRFTSEEGGLTPILSAVPPEQTMSRPDGHHSGNPIVREMVAQKLPQHLCWVYESESGTRGFGFTGGHFHDNWANDPFRKTVLNATCWIAGVEIPSAGIPTPTPSEDDLAANLDPKPERKAKNKK
ncbi:MAG: DUF1080 domain-containing protein [Verrucomicrobiales bacterium]